jgi:uncharacterized membrane protein
MKAILCAILAGLCWGVGEIFSKWALNTGQVGPMAVQMVRAAVTLPLTIVALLVAANFSNGEVPGWWRHLDGKVWLMLIGGSGLLAGFAGVFFFYLGLSLPGGDISKLRPIAFSLAPATAVLLGWLLLHEPMTVRKAVAVVLIIAGILLLAGGGKPTDQLKHALTTPATEPPR